MTSNYDRNVKALNHLVNSMDALNDSITALAADIASMKAKQDTISVDASGRVEVVSVSPL